MEAVTISPLDDPAETALIRRAEAGDDEAWLTLVLRHGEGLRRLAGLGLDPSLRGRIDPDDVVQEALIEAFRILGRFFESPVPFSVWLRQRVKDRLRGIRRDQRAQKRDARQECEVGSGWDVHLIDPGTSPSGRAARCDDGRMLHGAFDQLPEKDREILLMYFFEDASHGEIATILGLEEATVRKRLSRALARLGDHLQNAHPDWCHAFQSLLQRRPS